ncbi:MAG TPA: ABC transporter ATP-binding protein [Bradyrhizobium sp.]|nr:ABC transporter ATP-binding protein [Bradyrhizobium sp.]
MPLLSIQNVSRAFSGLVALNDVSFDVHASEVVGLIGPNGAGKTTMINLITGLTPPTSGDILLRGSSIIGMKPHRIARLGIARTFQHIRLFEDMSVLENVMIGLDTSLSSGYFATAVGLGSVRREEEAARAEATALLARLDPALHARRNMAATALSYADKRRVEIARALAMKPALLLLDEPAAGMAPLEMQGLAEDLRRLNTDGMAVIVIEHKMRLIEGVTHKVVVLDHGRKIFEGPFDGLRKDEDVVGAYLGRRYTNAGTAAC